MSSAEEDRPAPEVPGNAGGGDALGAPAPVEDRKLAPHPLVVGLAATMFGKKGVSEADDAAETAKGKLFEPRVHGAAASDDAIKEAVAKFLKLNRWELVK